MKKLLSAAAAGAVLALAACGAYEDGARLRNDVSRVYDDGYGAGYGDYFAGAGYGNSAGQVYDGIPKAYRMGTDGVERATEDVNPNAPRQFHSPDPDAVKAPENFNVNMPRQFHASERDAGRTPVPTTTTAAPATAR